jgi:ornithine carbamoyltransferase
MNRRDPHALLTLDELSATAIDALIAQATALKAAPRSRRTALRDRVVVLLFEKESLRTRVSFEIGVARLGGTAIYLDHRTSRIGEREPVLDYARNLERWADAIVARTYAHATVEALATHASIPVINGLSDAFHPCQALSDLFTLRERFGRLQGLRIAWVGDGNNVCHSLLLGAARVGVSVTVVSPPGYGPDAAVFERAAALGARCGAPMQASSDPGAVAGHHAVYTDTWISMGQEEQAPRRRADFAPYRVTAAMMDLAGPDSVFMHCLPAHRGDEVAAEVIDGPRSIVYDQAENRLHAQNALLLHLLGRPATRRPRTPSRHAIPQGT